MVGSFVLILFWGLHELGLVDVPLLFRAVLFRLQIVLLKILQILGRYADQDGDGKFDSADVAILLQRATSRASEQSAGLNSTAGLAGSSSIGGRSLSARTISSSGSGTAPGSGRLGPYPVLTTSLFGQQQPSGGMAGVKQE